MADLNQSARDLYFAFANELSRTLALANEASAEIRETCFQFRRLREAIETDLDRIEARIDVLTVALANGAAKTTGAK